MMVALPALILAALVAMAVMLWHSPKSLRELSAYLLTRAEAQERYRAYMNARYAQILRGER